MAISFKQILLLNYYMSDFRSLVGIYNYCDSDYAPSNQDEGIVPKLFLDTANWGTCEVFYFLKL